MQTTTTTTDLVLEMREDATNADVVGTGYGRAVPYGVETNLGNVRESFAAGAFDPADVIGRPLAYRHGEPIGVITGATNEADGLYIDFQIANTVQGRDAATLIRTGSSKGLSVGFNPVKSAWNRAKTSVVHTAAALAEVSITHQPAYATAGVSSIREEDHMSVETVTVEETAPAATIDTEAREAIAAVRRELATVAHVTEPAHPLAQYRSFSDYRVAVWEGKEEARALFDQVTTDNPGLMPPTWMTEIRGIINLGRRAITALSGPMSPGDSGMTVNWPYFAGDLLSIIEAQANEKDEVNSVQISFLKGAADLATYGAGSDISFQLLSRSSPSYLDGHNRVMLASYAQVTDRKFTSDLWTDGTGVEDYVFASDTTGAAFREAVFSGSVSVEDATGIPASVVLVSSAVFRAIGGWSTFYPSVYSVMNVSGTADARTLSVNVSGLPVVRAPWLDTNAAYDAIVTNSTAARWLESGPSLVAADNVAQLGRDVAIWGMGATASFIPAGVVKLSNVA
jgi:HK97 family phage prohead protease